MEIGLLQPRWKTLKLVVDLFCFINASKITLFSLFSAISELFFNNDRQRKICFGEHKRGIKGVNCASQNSLFRKKLSTCILITIEGIICS